jgi:protoporphyrinogen oxidase
MVSVDPDAKRVCFANGRVEPYDMLINTTPLDLFVNSCSSLPDAVRSSAEALVHNGGLIVGLGIDAPRNDAKCWIYFPESNSPFYRVTNFHNYSPHNVPGGDTGRYSSLMCETTYSPHKPEDKATIIDRTVRGLIDSGMMDRSHRQRIVSRYLIDIPYSYPVPTLGRDRALAVIQPWLESLNIYSRGRFGAWRYEAGNMDHSFMQGVEVVGRILAETPEKVFGRTG